jgi:hypothetical protein
MVRGPLIHIGYHKAGSTWLQNEMFNNPRASFVMPHGRKTILDEVLVQPHALDFDADKARELLQPAVEQTLNESKIPVISSERFSGVPNWGGYDSVELASRLHTVFPDGKILIIIREQVAMILSVYNQYVRGGGGCTLKDFIELGDRPGGYPAFRFEHFRYDRLISYYRRLFGNENVLALPFEMLRGCPEIFSNKIELFAGAPKFGDYNFRATPKASVGPFGTTLIRLTGPFLFRTADNGFSPFQIPLAKYAGYVHKRYLISNVYRPLGEIVLKKKLESRWRRIVEEKVRGRFDASNRTTSDLIGIDLAQFKYAI